MIFRRWNGLRRGFFFNREANRRFRVVPEEPVRSFARFIIGPEIDCEILRGERKIWFGYNPRNTIENLISSLKESLGIACDIGLYLQGFYIPPYLQASCLLPAREPILILPPRQTACEQMNGGYRTTTPTPAIEIIFPFVPPRSSTPIAVRQERQMPRLSPINLSHGTSHESSAEQTGVVSLPTTPNMVTSLTIGSVQISEMNPPTPIDSAPEAAGPVVEVRKGRLRSRKSKTDNDSRSSMKDDKTPLENSSTTNQSNSVRRSSRIASHARNEDASLNLKRASSVQDENAPPQKAKRIDSTKGNQTDNSELDVFMESPKKRPRSHKGKRRNKNLAEFPSFVSSESEGSSKSEKAEEANGGDDTPVGIWHIEKPTLIWDETLHTSRYEQNGSTPGVSSKSDFQSVDLTHPEVTMPIDVQDNTLTLENVSHNSKFQGVVVEPTNTEATMPIDVHDNDLTLENLEEREDDETKNLRDDTPEVVEEAVIITSVDQIESGNIIQADMLLMGEDGNAAVFTKVMEVMAKYGENVSVKFPVTPLADVGTIIPCLCCSPYGIYTVAFKDLIQPKFLDGAQLQEFREAHVVF